MRVLDLKFLFGMGLLLLAFSSVALAFPFSTQALSPANVALEKGQTITVPIRVTNLDVDPHSFAVSFDSNSGLVSGSSIVHQLTLASQQSAEFGITIRASNDALTDSYLLTAKIRSDTQTQLLPYTVYVRDNPFLAITSFHENACADDYTRNVSFSVRNSKSTSVDVNVEAEQGALAPFIDDATASIPSGDTHYFSMEIHPQPGFSGDYTGLVRVQTPEIWAQKAFTVTVKDCPSAVQKDFEMTLPSNPKSLIRFKSNNIPVQIKNVSDETQTITLSADSIIPSNVQTVQIPRGETATLQVAFTPGTNVSAGTYSVTFTATNGVYTQNKLLNLKVVAADHLDLSAHIPAFQLQKGSSATYSFTILNDGDTTQNLSFGMLTATPGMTYTFTPAAATLLKGQQTQVTWKVVAASNTSVSHVDNAILAFDKSQVRYDVHFDVLDVIPGQTEAVLEFLSSPSTVVLKQGESHSIQVVLHNTSARSLSGVTLRLAGNLSGFVDVQLAEDAIALAPYETRTIDAQLVVANNAPLGTVHSTLVVEGPAVAGAAPMNVSIESAGILSGLTGFFSFAGNSGWGFWILVVFVVLLILGYAYRAPTQNQPWKNPQ